MGTKTHPGDFDCHGKAKPDEPLFTLLARDPLAPDLLREWADRYVRRKRAEASQPGRVQTKEQVDRILDKASEARDCADAMEKWQKENPGV